MTEGKGRKETRERRNGRKEARREEITDEGEGREKGEAESLKMESTRRLTERKE